MSKTRLKLSPTKTLAYYDGPVLFLAEDEFKKRYLCMLDSDDRYVAVAVDDRDEYDVRKEFERGPVYELDYLLRAVETDRTIELPDEGFIARVEGQKGVF